MASKIIDFGNWENIQQLHFSSLFRNKEYICQYSTDIGKSQ